MLIREFIGPPAGCKWNYVRHFDRPIPFFWHYHPEYELALTRHAQGTRYLGSDVTSIGRYDLVLVAPNQAHSWHVGPHPAAAGGTQEMQVVQFSPDWLHELCRSALPELAAFAGWAAGVGEGVVFDSACVAQVLPLFDRLHVASDLVRLGLLLEIFDILMHDPAAQRLGTPGAAPGRDKRVELALAFLHREYQRPLPLAEVADAAATSVATLKRLFRMRLQMNITDVLIQLRIGHACHLLISTDTPVHLVGEQSGYASQANFFKQFGARRGLSPAEFRRRHHLREWRGALPGAGPRAAGQSSPSGV